MPRYLPIVVIAFAVPVLVIAGRATSVEPSAFSHSSHGTINCLHCHHDWPQSRAMPRCKGCHLGQPALRRDIESQFHALCRGCHAEQYPAQEAPAVRCSGCHSPPAGNPGTDE